MSKRLWLLIEWVEDEGGEGGSGVVPEYGVVSVASLIGHKADLDSGKLICVRKKHAEELRRGKILQKSDNKSSLKDQKALLEKQGQQMQNMLSLCMSTIMQMKSQSLKNIDAPHTDPMMMKMEQNEKLPFVIMGTDSETESDDHRRNESKEDEFVETSNPVQKFKTNGYSSAAVSPSNRSSSRSTTIICSTPNQMTYDQGTQTDDNYFLANDDRFIYFDQVLRDLYKTFRSLVTNLEIDEAYESCKEESDVDLTNKSGTDNSFEELLNNRDGEPETSGKLPEVRRASAHTTYNGELVPIGKGYAKVEARVLEKIDWNHYTSATRKLLQTIFPKRVLATHSLTGKCSPAFRDKPPKIQLDPKLTEDIILEVASKCNVTKVFVKKCITSTLTDEAKLFKKRQEFNDQD